MSLRPFLLSELAARLDVVVHGDDVRLTGAAGIEDAGPEDISFLRIERPISHLESCRAGAVILSPAHGSWSGPHLRHPQPRYVFALALEMLLPRRLARPGIHATAVIAEDARIGSDCEIGPYAVIGRQVLLGDGCIIGAHAVIGESVRVGKDCRIDSHVVIYDGAQIGARTTIFAAAVIGCDGFGFEPKEDGLIRLQHIGSVVIGDDVEIGAGTHVDRGTTGNTVIGSSTKIDNQVMVGHNCRIGRACIVAGQTGFAGSCVIGDGVVIGGDCSFADHTVVGSGARIGGRSAVHGRVEPGAVISGHPARDHRAEMREVAALKRLPELLRRLRTERRGRLGEDL